MNKLVPAAKLLFAIALLQLASCKKADLEDILHHPGKTPKTCDITRIISLDPKTNDLDTAMFSYNSHGDPVSILFNQGLEGRADHYFGYDSQRRLTDYVIAHTPAGQHVPLTYDVWHHYTYQDDLVIYDTRHFMGNYVNGQPDVASSPYSASKLTYGYDSLKRIRVITEPSDGPKGDSPVGYIYNPNGDGNLVEIDSRNGSIGFYEHDYDTKLNIHRTSKVWMFIDANYSINNPIPATSYNSYQLPLKYENAQIPTIGTLPAYLTLIPGLYLTNSSITYNCK